MRVWVIKDGENLPVQTGSRKMRTWLLSEALAAEGCEVTWWATTFSHQRKSLVCDHDCQYAVSDQISLRLLHCGSYRRNVSFARIKHHQRFGKALRSAIAGLPPPDAIVCSFPIIEAAAQMTAWAQSHGIPVIVDVRDYWPDLYLDRIPGGRYRSLELLCEEVSKIPAKSFVALTLW